MELKDPIAIYNAATNLEAQLIANHLNSHQISSFAVEDASAVGTYTLGLIPEIHKPQVFVDRANAVEARALIEEYENANREQLEHPDSNALDYCHACGERVSRGTPICPGCDRPLEWADPEESESESASIMSTLKKWKKPLAIFILTFPFIINALLAWLDGLSKR